MKSLADYRKEVRCLSLAFTALIDDIKAGYPGHAKGLERDKDHVLALVKTRGLSVFTLDLPGLDEPLLRGLRDGCYNAGGIALSRAVHRRGRIPRLFEGLYLAIFTQHGMLREAPDGNALFFLRQIFNLGKKIRVQCKEVKVYETIKSFYQTDLELPEPTVSSLWDDSVDSGVHRSLVDYVDRVFPSNLEYNRRRVHRENRRVVSLMDCIQKVADVVSTTIGLFDPLEWRCKHGPGAISEQSGVVDKWSITHWPEQLEPIFPSAEFAFANYDDWVNRLPQLKPSMLPTASRLIQVPKTQKAPRLIAAEPLALQFCQQNIYDFIKWQVKHTWLGSFISFDDQQPNQVFAMRGSIDGKLATLDLSEASDRVSLYLIERLFRRNPSFLEALASCRSRYVRNEISRYEPKLHRLKKFSTMGSACTFPVETLAFLCIVLGVICEAENIQPNERNLKLLHDRARVFGDDIVVPSGVLGSTRAVFALLDFKVNDRKTFGNGNFRESCGVDAFMGLNVTPIRILTAPSKDRPESVVSAIDTSNNLHRAGLWNCAAAVTSMVDTNCISIVGHGSGAFGLESFTGPSHLRVRWNDSLSRWEYRTLVVKTKRRRNQREGNANILQFFLEDPAGSGVSWKLGYDLRPKLTLSLGWGSVNQSMSINTL